MAKNKEQESPFKQHLNVVNKKAGHEYFLIDKYIAGIVLRGTEVKSLRLGKVNLQDAYCYFKGNELFSKGIHISEYKDGTRFNHEEKAERKLLLKKKELSKLQKGIEEDGMSIVPVRIFFSEKGLAKLEIALAKGKKLYDKRETIKENDIRREMLREGKKF